MAEYVHCEAGKNPLDFSPTWPPSSSSASPPAAPQLLVDWASTRIENRAAEETGISTRRRKDAEAQKIPEENF